MSGTSSDLSALASLLSAQQLAVATQAVVLTAAPFSAASAATRSLAATIHAADLEHVAATRREIVRRGGHPAPAPQGIARIDAGLIRHRIPGRPARLRGVGDALRLLLSVEQAAVGAGYRAVGAMDDGALAALAAAMMGSDAQHEALLRERLRPGDISSAVPVAVVEGII